MKRCFEFGMPQNDELDRFTSAHLIQFWKTHVET